MRPRCHNSARDDASEHAAAMANLERRPCVVWLVGPDKYVVTSYRVGDERRDGFVLLRDPDPAQPKKAPRG